MSGTTLQVPPFKVLAKILRKTTEHLAREVVQPSAAPPDWNELEWAIARSSAAMQGISTLLANRLRWSGPPIWRSFLAEQREQSLIRDARIDRLLDQIDTATQQAGIACVALKGAALRALELYAPGERPMGDIDLLVHTRDLEATELALASIGYARAFTAKRHTVYAPQHSECSPHGFGEHAENPLKVEVHAAVAESLPIRNVDITSNLRPTWSRPGVNSYPDLRMLMLHLMLHAAGNMRAHALRQIQLHDIAALARILNGADLQTLLVELQTGKRRWWIYPPLALTNRYYEDAIPPHVLREARSACPRALRYASERRTLTCVSWSNLRIHAFPGIAWSRTPLDVLRFVRSRALPTRTALAELELTRHAQPQLDRVPWYGAPHRNRIFRWLVSRPPRVQTMVSVMAALESAGPEGPTEKKITRF